MKRQLWVVLSGLLVCGITLGAAKTGSKGSGLTPTSRVPLSEEAILALDQALAGPTGEYALRARYAAVLEKFQGVEDVRPFDRIIDAEQRHVDALVKQYTKYGLQPPEDTWLGNVTAPETMLEAAEDAVEFEIANGDMYETLLTSVVGYSSLLNTFDTLMNASLDNHTPAFERAIKRLSR